MSRGPVAPVGLGMEAAIGAVGGTMAAGAGAAEGPIGITGVVNTKASGIWPAAVTNIKIYSVII